MKPLVDDMTQADPTKRPTIDQVITRFDVLRRSLGSWKLRSRAVQKNEDIFLRGVRAAKHLKQRIYYMVHRIPPVPVP